MTWDASTMSITAKNTAHGAAIKLVDGSGMGCSGQSHKHERGSSDTNMWASSWGFGWLSIDLGVDKVIEQVETIPWAHDTTWARSMKTVAIWAAKDGVTITTGEPSVAKGWTQIGTGTVNLTNPQTATGTCLNPNFHDIIGDDFYSSEFPAEFRYFGIVCTAAQGTGSKCGLSEIIFHECAPRPTPTPTPTPEPCSESFEVEAKVAFSGSRSVTDSADCGESGHSGHHDYDWSSGDMDTDSKWELYVQDMEIVPDPEDWIADEATEPAGLAYGAVIHEGAKTSGTTELEWEGTSAEHTVSTGGGNDVDSIQVGEGHGLKLWYGVPGYDVDGTSTLNECTTSGTPTSKTVKITANSGNSGGITVFYRAEDATKEKCYLTSGEYKTFTLTADAGMPERNKIICDQGNFICPSGTTNAGIDQYNAFLIQGENNGYYGQKGEYPLCMGASADPKGDKILVVCGDETGNTSDYPGFSVVSPD
jgi:hypothetical protein